MAEQISAADFQQKVLESDQPVLVDFFATWCGPCKMMSPVIEEVAADTEGSAKVYKLDIDESPEIAQKYGVMSVPTFITFKEGAIYKQTIGAKPKDQILELLA